MCPTGFQQGAAVVLTQGLQGMCDHGSDRFDAKAVPKYVASPHELPGDLALPGQPFRELDCLQKARIRR